MRYVPRALLAGLLGFAVALLAGCGSSGGLLSTDQASTLNAQLNAVSSALAARNCAAADNAASTLTDSASSLGGVDATLSSTVSRGADAVASLVQRECPTATRSTSSTTTTSSSSTSTTQSVPTTTTTTTTTPTTTSTTSTTTTTSTTPTTSTSTTTGGGTGGAGIGNGSTTGTTGTSTAGGAGLPGAGAGSGGGGG